MSNPIYLAFHLLVYCCELYKLPDVSRYHEYLKDQPKRRGASSRIQAKGQTLWNNMRFFGFDSFQGLPELIGVDQQTEDFEAGQYSASEQ